MVGEQVQVESFFEFYPQKPAPSVLIMKIEINCTFSGDQRREIPFFKTPRTLFLTRFILKENYFMKAWHMWVLQQHILFGDEKIPNTSPLQAFIWTEEIPPLFFSWLFFCLLNYYVYQVCSDERERWQNVQELGDIPPIFLREGREGVFHAVYAKLFLS